MNEKDLDRILQLREIIIEFAYLKGYLMAWLLRNLKQPINYLKLFNEINNWHEDKIEILRKELHELELKLLTDEDL